MKLTTKELLAKLNQSGTTQSFPKIQTLWSCMRSMKMDNKQEQCPYCHETADECESVKLLFRRFRKMIGGNNERNR